MAPLTVSMPSAAAQIQDHAGNLCILFQNLFCCIAANSLACCPKVQCHAGGQRNLISIQSNLAISYILKQGV